MSDEAFRLRLNRWKNTTGEEVPPFACLVVTDTYDDGQETYYLVRKATHDDEMEQNAAKLVFNFGEYVVDTSFGSCSSDYPAAALVDETDEPVAGDIVGPVEDEWFLAPGRNAFVLKAKEQNDPHVEGTAHVWQVEVHTAEVEIVRVTSASPDVDGFYSGVVERFDPDTLTWSTVRSCKVRDVNA